MESLSGAFPKADLVASLTVTSRFSMEQMETVQRLAGCSFGVGGVPFWGKLRASQWDFSVPPVTACRGGNGHGPVGAYQIGELQARS